MRREAVAEHCPNWFLALMVYFPLSAKEALQISRLNTLPVQFSLRSDVASICRKKIIALGWVNSRFAVDGFYSRYSPPHCLSATPLREKVLQKFHT